MQEQNHKNAKVRYHRGSTERSESSARMARKATTLVGSISTAFEAFGCNAGNVAPSSAARHCAQVSEMLPPEKKTSLFYTSADSVSACRELRGGRRCS